MKKLLLMSALLFSTAFIYNNNAQAQVRVSVNFNIGSQPLWGPTGYDYVEYYYLPDIGAYYSVAQQQYIYNSRGRWIYANTLPPMYRNFDLYNSYKVVINERSPWLRDNVYRSRYASYRGRHGQPIIRDSRDNKYWERRDHPKHNQWKGRNDHDNGRGKGHGNGHGRGNGHGKGHGRGR